MNKLKHAFYTYGHDSSTKYNTHHAHRHTDLMTTDQTNNFQYQNANYFPGSPSRTIVKFIFTISQCN